MKFIAKMCTPLLAAAAGIVGCGSENDRTASQVAAKVNQDEISVHQINYVLQRQGGVPPEQVPAARREILEQLIDRTLAVQRAEALDLEDEPATLMALEAARQETLARIYAERLAGSVPTPTADEIMRYYADHPELFRDRRVYQLQELLISVGPERADEVMAAMRRADGASGMIDWLKREDVKFAAQQATRAAEQLPLADLSELATLKAGQAIVRRNPAGVQVVIVASVRPDPVDERAATRAIEQYLINDRKRKILGRDRDALRSAAKVVYGEGYQAPDSGGAGSSADAADPVSSGVSPGVSPETLRNGLKGLK